jgi:hypothetical protein
MTSIAPEEKDLVKMCLFLPGQIKRQREQKKYGIAF